MNRFDVVMLESDVERPCIVIIRNLPIETRLNKIKELNFNDMGYIQSRLVKYHQDYMHESTSPMKMMLYMFCRNQDAVILRERFMKNFQLGTGGNAKIDFD